MVTEYLGNIGRLFAWRRQGTVRISELAYSHPKMEMRYYLVILSSTQKDLTSRLPVLRQIRRVAEIQK